MGLTSLWCVFPQPFMLWVEEREALLVATGTVGRAMGLNIRPLAQSEDFSGVKDPVEAKSELVANSHS